MELKVVDDFMDGKALEALDRDDFGKGGDAIVSSASWDDTVKEIKARKAARETRMASFRIPVSVIEGLKRNAAKGGVKYSEYVIATLAKASV